MEVGFVGGGVGGVADDDGGDGEVGEVCGLDEVVDSVFRFEPADVEDVLIRLQVEPGEDVGGIGGREPVVGSRGWGGAVGDVGEAAVVRALEVALDMVGIGDDGLGGLSGELFGAFEEPAGDRESGP